MKTKILWTMLSCLMVIALVLTSCTTATEEEEKEVTNGGEALDARERPVCID